MQRLFVAVTLLTIGQLVICDEPSIVETSHGKVRGYYRHMDNGDRAIVYEGIPFAKPPVGELRFQKPQPLEPWDGIYNATKIRFACLQQKEVEPDNNVPDTIHFSEDCLYLNVFKPSKNPDKKRPVMMWIHGGGYETGSIFSIAYDARYLVTLGDVIVVATNYRVGALGFLYGSTEDSVGSSGIYDQVAALKWIKENIEAFGGDPNSVTIFGESAGGMSTGCLILSPLTEGLFHRAIMQSGAPNSYLGSEAFEPAMVKTHSLAEKLNCTNDDKKKMMKCLRAVSGDAIIEATKDSRLNGETFLPVWGGEIMPTRPVEALKTGKYNKGLDFMFGTVANEGSLFVDALFPDDLSPSIKNPQITSQHAAGLIMLMFMSFKEPYATEVADFYLKGVQESDKDSIRAAVAYSFGHYHLTCPTVFFGQAYALGNKHSKVFAYRQMHPPGIPVFPDCHGYMGVCHGDDVMMLFGFPLRLRGIVFTEDDYAVARDMINAWTTFAKTGQPSDMNGVKWEPAIDLSKANPSVSYMAIDGHNNHTMVHDYYTKNCDAFWRSKIFV